MAFKSFKNGVLVCSPMVVSASNPAHAYNWVSKEVALITSKYNTVDSVEVIRRDLSFSETKEGERRFVCRPCDRE